MNFDEFLKSLPKIKNIPLPAEPSQFKMVPTYRREQLKSLKYDINNVNQAGVMALFYPDINHDTTMVLIERKANNGIHSAQVAFPGGKMEHTDKSYENTAIRETFEEVGVPMNTIEIIKELSHVYIPPSNYYVQPFLGITNKTPQFIKQDDEVEAILEIPLKIFLDERVVVKTKVSTSYSVDVEVPAFKLNGYVVWGATAMMLSEIKDLLKQLM